jgi:multidrug efflux pump subunit AcrA (membrane-fusion protein)
MVTAFSMSSDDQMTVTVSVDESDINSVKTGQTATVSLDALETAEGEGFDGEITEVSSASSSGSGGNVKYAVTITVDKTDDMKSGMTASAVINIEEAENVIVIPSAAVNEKGGKTFVYTRNDDGTLAGETEIETGLSNGSQVEVKSGLDEGTTVYYEVRQSGSSDKSSGNEKSGMGGMGERPDMGSMPEGGPGGNGGGMPSGGKSGDSGSNS